MKIFKKWWFWLIIVLVAGGAAAAQNKKDETPKETNPANVATNTKSDVGNTNTVNPTQGTEPVATKAEEIAYEITDTQFAVEDSVLGGKEFNVILEVKNTGNVPIYLKDCVLDFEDDQGHLLHTYDFLSKVPDVIEPGEKGYFYTNGNSSFDKEMSFDNGCNLKPSIKVEKAKKSLKRHEVTDTSLYTNIIGSVGIKGRITNETNEEISLIYVTTVFYDKDGKVLGISGSNVTGISPNGKTSFDTSGLLMKEFTVEQVDSYKVYADESYYQF